MRIADLGEFALIERLRQIIATSHPDVVVGIGDDAAALATEAGSETLLLATVDSHVEHIHFLPFLSTPHQIGRRVLVVNASDIAAMGGQPYAALVALALPGDTPVAWVEAFYEGMHAEAGRLGVLIIGGNITRSPAGIVADVTMLGRVRREHLLRRSGAQPGDHVLVTGHPGDAYAGLQLVFHPRLAVAPTVRETLITRYIEPHACVTEAAVIARSQQATAMIDVSDGLSSDIGHICAQSGVGVRIWAERLPLSPAARQVAEALQQSAWKLALEGGDDYGLCFTVPPSAVAHVSSAIRQETGTLVHAIGEIVPAEEGAWLILPDGAQQPLDAAGWQHF